MPKRDRERITKLRTIIRYMLERGTLAPGDQSRLAEHFSLTRQRVNQLVTEERKSIPPTSIAPKPAPPSRRASG